MRRSRYERRLRGRRATTLARIGLLALVGLGGLLAPSVAGGEDAPPPVPPTLTLPGDMTAEAKSPAGAAISFRAVATDWKGRAVPVKCEPASGAEFALGRTVVGCEATDRRHKTTTGSFAVVVRDTTPPRLASHADVVANATSLAGAKVSYTQPRAIDVVDPAPKVECTPAPGAIFGVGITTVRCGARDGSGNASRTSFGLTVRTLFAPSDGATISAPPLLRWLRISNASFYNVQLYRKARARWIWVLSAWPSRPSLQLRSRWAYKGARRLVAGRYQWFVWPSFGSRYGPLLGTSGFVVRRS
jgi:hypothetical protein